MKTDIFINAISNRFKVSFLYAHKNCTVEPYYVSRNKEGKKVVFGRISSSNEIKMFEYDKIFNIRVQEFSKFSPIIPILQYVN